MTKRKVGRPKGYKLSEEAKEAIRQKRLGKKWDDETKAKIATSITEWWAKRKEG